MKSLHTDSDWTKSSGTVFWAEIAPYDHVVQIYDHDETFLNTLFAYVTDGIKSDDCVIVIATKPHLESLNERLHQSGFRLEDLSARNLYVPMEAEVALSKFMVNDWPDATLFLDLVSGLIANAKKDNRRVRAFGEMVAVLWAREQVGATVRLEQLWNTFCESQAFCLFCAYPQSGFTQDAVDSVMHICSAHSKMITTGNDKGLSDIYFKSMGIA